MEDVAVLVAGEHADTGQFVAIEWRGAEIVFVLALVDLLPGKGDAVIGIEGIAARGEPIEAPAHPLLERLELIDARQRDRDNGGVSRGKMRHYPIKTVGPERAALAGGVPVRPKHHMLDHELGLVPEQISQGYLA